MDCRTGLIFFVLLIGLISSVSGNFFDDKYDIVYGKDHINVVENQGLVELSLDQFSGSCFKSKVTFGSGYFNIHMKLPNNKDSHAVLSTFYLSSVKLSDDVHPPQADRHDELDFEFYGNNHLPIILQTNVFIGGHGNREQKVALWFDPRADFHSYTILWNQWHIVFLVDEIPVRVFKNLTQIGQKYITQPMSLWASIWNASWAEQGRPIKWDQAPFKSSYKKFNIQGCPATGSGSFHYCNLRSGHNWWNEYQYRHLNTSQQEMYEVVREKRLVYDYCTDETRYPTIPVECRYNI